MDLLSEVKYLGHLLNLLRPFIIVVLVDTNAVNPNDTIHLLIAEMVKHIVSGWPDKKFLVSDPDVPHIFGSGSLCVGYGIILH